MSNEVIWVVLPLLITGMGFLSYKHPRFTRIIVICLFGALLLSYGYIITRSDGILKGYNQAEYITHMPIYESLAFDKMMEGINFDSLMIEDPLLNKLNAKWGTDENQNKMSKALVVSHSVDMTKQKIKNSINDSISKEYKERLLKRNYCMWIGIALFVFLLLTYAFEYLNRPKSKKKYSRTNQSPY